MLEVTFFSILGTKSSEVSNKNFFITGGTIYIPDFFILIFCMSLFTFSAFLDLVILLFLFVHSKLVVIVVFALSSFLHGILEFIIEKSNNDLCCKTIDTYLKSVFPPIISKVVVVPVYVLGFGSVLMLVRIFIEIFQRNGMFEKPLSVFPHPIFHISEESLSVIKIYCCINLAVKSIPQLFIAPVFILGKHVGEGAAFILVTNILLNILIFSQTMATTFPIRRTPRVFTSCVCILLSAFCKFMATTCACYLNLAVFAMTFKQISYLAILSSLVKPLIWVWPCWQLLKHQPTPLSKMYFYIYTTFISLIFSFIYIHPFEHLGKLYYYIFYLLSFLYELFNMYYLSDVNIESVTYYFTLKFLMFGFLSCFGLLNILHKYRKDEHEWKKYSNELMSKEESIKKDSKDEYELKKYSNELMSKESIKKDSKDEYELKKNSSELMSKEESLKKDSSDEVLVYEDQTNTDKDDKQQIEKQGN